MKSTAELAPESPVPEKRIANPERDESRNLERAHAILTKDTYMDCNISQGILFFHGIYKKEELALAAKEALENLGFSPEVDGKRLKIEESISGEEEEIAKILFKK